jgi:hypothetical protein
MRDTSPRGRRGGFLPVVLAAVSLLAAVPARAQAAGGSCDKGCLESIQGFA